MSICHTINMSSLSICQTHDMSVCHTNIMTSPSVCPSCQSSDCHTTTKTSPSICQSRIPSVYHTVILTSPSICQLQDSSVCKRIHDVTKSTICPTVCSSPVMSILPSANSTVKIPTSIPVHKFLHALNPGKFPSTHTSMDLSVHHSDSPSVNLSPSAANPSKIPCKYGEKNVVNYLHENMVKSPSISTSYVMPFSTPVHASSVQSVCTSCVTFVIAPVCASSIQPIHTLCITSVIAPVHASPIPSVHPSDNECQEFPEEFPGTKYAEKNLSEIMVNFPDDVTLTLHQVKFPEETPDTTSRVIYLGSSCQHEFGLNSW